MTAAAAGVGSVQVPPDDRLLVVCDRVANVHAKGSAIQSIYYTRPGPGPLDVTDICNLDPETGLNTVANTA
jgi:hypothetical protein